MSTFAKMVNCTSNMFYNVWVIHKLEGELINTLRETNMSIISLISAISS